jgi:F0F1-type ATP synthase epsilon subunit
LSELLTLRVVSPGQVIFEGSQLKRIVAQLPDGEIAFYPGHTPLLAETVDGAVIYDDGDNKNEMLLFGGILRVDENVVTIFTGGRLTEEAIDAGRTGLFAETSEVEEEFSRFSQALVKRLKL